MKAIKISLVVIALVFTFAVGHAQSPVPVVVDAASSAPATAATSAAPVTQEADSLKGALEILEQMKSANAELLKKQEATLQRLDELAQEAEQLRIFSSRK